MKNSGKKGIVEDIADQKESPMKSPTTQDHPAYTSLCDQLRDIDISDAQIANSFSFPIDMDPSWQATMYRVLAEYRPKAFMLVAMVHLEERGLGSFVQAVMDSCVPPATILLRLEGLMGNILEELPLAALVYDLVNIQRSHLARIIRPKFRNTLEIPLHRL